MKAGFKPGKTVLAPGIGGSAGNATYQLERAQGAGKVISTAGSAAKAAKARELGFQDVVDLAFERPGYSGLGLVTRLLPFVGQGRMR
jgi:NADPH2:quinone reductase